MDKARIIVNRHSFKFSDTFQLRDGFMYCENTRIRNIQDSLQERFGCRGSPVFVHSERQIQNNVRAYTDPLKSAGFPYLLGYSIKANYNPALLRVLAEAGCSAVAVSGLELELARSAGLDMSRVVMNGNGKTDYDLQVAIENDCLTNVDSSFDLEHVIVVAKQREKKAHVQLRLNPNIDSQVHPFLATGLAASKFGIDEVQLRERLEHIKNEENVELVGLHCHLGSTIYKTEVFQESLEVMLELIADVKRSGFDKIQYLNLGGGLGIDYKTHAWRTTSTSDDVHDKIQIDHDVPPDAGDLINAIKSKMLESGLSLVLEPGRSLVGNSAMLVAKTLGTKHNGNSDYLVVDASMNEVIRPAMYGAYHHVEYTEPLFDAGHSKVYDVVGPVCECADFVALSRTLPTPQEGCGVAMFDTGAYCASMAGNYNMRMRPAEVLVSNDTWRLIRKPESFEDVMQSFKVNEANS